MSRGTLRVCAAIAAGILALAGSAAAYPAAFPLGRAAAPVDTTLWKTMRWRGLGPDRGGRSIAVSGVKGDPKVAYFGAAGGGLWKTTNAGETWAPVTDGQITSASVGAVAVAESDPNIVFIGMGETCIRGNILPGAAVQVERRRQNVDEHRHQIPTRSQIRIHPTDRTSCSWPTSGNTARTARARRLQAPTAAGVAQCCTRTRVGGDRHLDRREESNVLYAALGGAAEWRCRRQSEAAWESTDGGETWTDITRSAGLPAGMVGRIGVSVSRANPNRVYALVENENGGLFRSEDAGAT